jgi:hypothetical protein
MDSIKTMVSDPALSTRIAEIKELQKGLFNCTTSSAVLTTNLLAIRKIMQRPLVVGMSLQRGHIEHVMAVMHVMLEYHVAPGALSNVFQELESLIIAGTKLRQELRRYKRRVVRSVSHHCQFPVVLADLIGGYLEPCTVDDTWNTALLGSGGKGRKKRSRAEMDSTDA